MEGGREQRVPSLGIPEFRVCTSSQESFDHFDSVRFGGLEERGTFVKAKGGVDLCSVIKKFQDL